MQGAALVAVRHIMSNIFSFLFGRPLTLPSRTLQADIRRKSGNFILNTLFLKLLYIVNYKKYKRLMPNVKGIVEPDVNGVVNLM